MLTGLFSLLATAAAQAQTKIVIATVNNGDMIIMQKLSKEFEKAHPDIKLDWVVLEENVLRERVTTDIATRGGSFDVMTIGTYETPIWAKKSWLIRFDENWTPELTSPEWKEAVSFYVDMMKKYGPPGASSNGHNENRALFATGKCAMWIDATVAAGYLANPKESKVADKLAFAPAPT